VPAARGGASTLVLAHRSSSLSRAWRAPGAPRVPRAPTACRDASAPREDVLHEVDERPHLRQGVLLALVERVDRLRRELVLAEHHLERAGREVVGDVELEEADEAQVREGGAAQGVAAVGVEPSDQLERRLALRAAE